MDTNPKNDSKKTIIGRTRQFYTELTENKTPDHFKCKICEKHINGKSSSNLIAHMRNQHKNVYFEKIAPEYESEENVEVQRLKLVHSCVEMVTINSHSFNTLSQSGFRNAVESITQKLQLAGCGLNLTDHHVYEIKEKIREITTKIKNQIESEVKGKLISVMVDAATRNGRSIFGVSIQYRINGILKLVALGMREMKKSHTAIYLNEILGQILSEYDISRVQVLSITTDNGSNVLAMVKEFEQQLLHDSEDNSFDDRLSIIHPNDLSLESCLNDCDETENEIENEIQKYLNEHIDADEEMLDLLLDESDLYVELVDSIVSDMQNRNMDTNLFVYSVKCAAHTLQLAVKDALKLIHKSNQNVISLCRYIAICLRKQSTRDKMREIGLSCKLPALDVATRWSSSFLMVNNIHLLLFIYEKYLIWFFKLIIDSRCSAV